LEQDAFGDFTAQQCADGFPDAIGAGAGDRGEFE